MCSRWSIWVKADSPTTKPLVFPCQQVTAPRLQILESRIWPLSGPVISCTGLLQYLLTGLLPSTLVHNPLVCIPYHHSHPFEICQITFLLKILSWLFISLAKVLYHSLQGCLWFCSLLLTFLTSFPVTFCPTNSTLILCYSSNTPGVLCLRAAALAVPSGWNSLFLRLPHGPLLLLFLIFPQMPTSQWDSVNNMKNNKWRNK